MRQKQLSSYQTGIGNEVTGNTPETRKNDSQTKRTLFTERFAAMVGMRPRKKEGVITGVMKSRPLERFPRQQRSLVKKENRIQRAAGNSAGPLTELKIPPVELGDLMLKLEQMDKKLKSSEEERHEMKREVRHKKVKT